MLKAGEYSPNNPLIRSERNSGDVLLALGEYERRRNTLRRLRQQQYKEYLDQQAKKKQEAKEQADRERREREERDREREQRAREREDAEREQREKESRERERRLAEQNRRSPELRRASDSVGGYSNVTKVDSAVQVDSITSPLSVAVQTDDAEFFRLPSPKFQLTQAERELSPHTALDSQDRPKPANLTPWSTGSTWEMRPNAERRRSYGDYDERPITVRKSNRDKLTSDLRHSYMPSIFDADAIERRNLQAEKEAAARRQFYQQELKNQIMEQQRIKEERKTREKMLEQAEMRRLEEQLKMLRMAQEEEIGKQKKECLSMKQDAEEFDLKRTELQKEIDIEQNLLRGPLPHRRTETSRSEETKLPKIRDRIDTNQERKAYSSNIITDPMFSSNYDVDSYLRKNLNFKDGFDRFNIDNVGNTDSNPQRYPRDKYSTSNTESVEIYKHNKPKSNEKKIVDRRKLLTQTSLDSLPIPVLRHTPLTPTDNVENADVSDAMKKVEEKWSVPVVQKNILKSMPNDEGRNVSILTQLGSIRRQLQLEQLKLDRMSTTE